METLMNKKIKLCITIVLILLILSILSIFFLHKSADKGTIAEIIQDGQCIQTIDLSQVDEPYELTVTGENNASNTIRVEPGRIAITKASCPDKICIQTGYISDSLKPITCLPNHLIIRIQTANENPIDGISN